MPVDYTISKPTPGTSRATSPTESEILIDVSDTIADVGGRLDTVEADKAPLASPALTGTPTAPTAAAGTDTTQVATTEFVVTETDKAMRVLAETRYDPATIAVYTAAGTAFADLDAVNMAVTFTASATEVLVVLEALAHCEDGGTILAWNLRDAGGNIAGTDHRVLTAAGGGVSGDAADQKRVHLEQRVTGLTPGNVYTWKWGFAREVAVVTALARTLAGGVAGAAIMRVVHAPIG